MLVFVYQYIITKSQLSAQISQSKDQKTTIQTLQSNIQNQESVMQVMESLLHSPNQAILTATPTSGDTPLTVAFSGAISDITIGSNPLVLDYGDGGLDKKRCSINFLGKGNCTTNGCDIWTMKPGEYSHTYKTAGTYVARISVGKNCTDGCIACTPSSNVITSITITAR